MTRFGRRQESLPDLMAEAARAALADADVESPDAIVVAAMKPGGFTGEGNYGSPHHHPPGLSPPAPPPPRASEIIGPSIDPNERRYGTTMPALAGLITRAVMHRTGLTLREISQVAVKNHAHATRNPYAHFQEAVTLEAVMDSRMVADPLRLYHCCPIPDGAAAVVLHAEAGPVRVAGIGQGTEAIAVRYRSDLTSFRATPSAAPAAHRLAGFGPERGAAAGG